MSGDWESRAFRGSSLPAWKPWVSRVAGVACFAAAVMSGIAIWREPSGLGVAVFGVCVIVGALLVVLPEYFRYYAALQETPPLPDRIEEAFDETYSNLHELAEALGRIGEVVADLEREKEISARQPAEEPAAEWREELEEALTQLKLDCDAVEERLRPILPDDDSGGSKTLPSGMLARALSGSGKGKGFPIDGREERKS